MAWNPLDIVGAISPNLAPSNASVTNNQTAQPVYDNLGRQYIMVDPKQQMDLQNQSQQDAANTAYNLIHRVNQDTAGLANQAQNLNTQRTMAVNAQLNAANNVANQLNNLQAARQTNANAISNAMNSVAGMYR